jgi:hypothetical protein
MDSEYLQVELALSTHGHAFLRCSTILIQDHHCQPRVPLLSNDICGLDPAGISDHGCISDGQQVHDDTNRLTVTDNWLMVMDDDGWWILTLDRSLQEVQKYRRIILRFVRKKKNLGREPTCVSNILAVSGEFKCGVRISTDGISVVLGMEAKILLVRASHHHLAVHRKLEYEFGTEPCECVVEVTSGSLSVMTAATTGA